jgi:hypothetical protein
MKAKVITLGAVVTTALAVAAVASAALPRSAALVISHQTRGCHIWSVNGGAKAVHQTIRLRTGGAIMVTNNDLMAQELVKTLGPAVTMKLAQRSHMGGMMSPKMSMGKAGPYTMGHMGATLRVTFPRAATYRFKLVDRGDYFEGIKTVGPDNTLTLTILVS